MAPRNLPRYLALIALLVIIGSIILVQPGPGVAQSPTMPNNTYLANQLNIPLSQIDYVNDSPGGISAVHSHRGYLIVPVAYDHGGGEFLNGDKTGGIQIYDISNVYSPTLVYDTKLNQSRFYDTASAHYLGDIAEIHTTPVWGDLIMLPLRKQSTYGGAVIINLAPFFSGGDIEVVGRYKNNASTTNYEAYPFGIAWVGGRYAYLPMGSEGLHIIDTTDPTSPQLVNSLTTAQIGNYNARWAYTIGNRLILSRVDLGPTSFPLSTFDISDPVNPVLKTNTTIAQSYGAQFDGRYFYGNGSPLQALDLSNMVTPTLITLDASPTYSGNPEYGERYKNFYFVGTVGGYRKYQLNFPSAATFVSSYNEQGPSDDYAFTTVYGNITITTSDHDDAVSYIIPHATAQDTTGPAVIFETPRDDDVNVNIKSPIGVAFDERIEVSSVSTSTFIVRTLGGNALPGRYTLTANRVEFLPNTPLATNTTYEIYLPSGGIKDVLGNGLASNYLTQFSTGNTIETTACPVTTDPDMLAGGVAQLSGQFVGLPGTPEFSWNFGDGSSTTSYSTATGTITHTYSTAGRFLVTLNARIGGNTCSRNAVQVVGNTLTGTAPANSSTIAYDATNDIVWNVNPDSDTVSAINANTLGKLAEIPVGDGPHALALGAGTNLWVANTEEASITVINRSTRQVVRTINLTPGSAPVGIVFEADGSNAYVTLRDTGQVVRIPAAASSPDATLNVNAYPRGIARDANDRLIVTHFISPDQHGLVSVINAAFSSVSTTTLALSTNSDTQDNGRGLPNYLGNLAISPDGTHAMIPGKKDNIQRGTFRDSQALDHDNTVRSLGIKLTLGSPPSENFSARMDFDDADFTTAVAYSPEGTLAFFASSGSGVLVAVDVFSPTNRFSISTNGQAPDGLTLDPGRKRIFVHNFMSRKVAVIGAEQLLTGEANSTYLVAHIPVVADEALSGSVLRGKQLFYDTQDPRMTSEGYMSCASCHLDGFQDGRVWDLTSLGEGLRNTINLRGRGGFSNPHGPRHWTGNFDEVQDFENQIRSLNEGDGLLSDAQFNTGTRSNPLGDPKAGLSSDLDALAAYVNSLVNVGVSPYRDTDGTLSSDGEAGKILFQSAGCATCHVGSTFSDSASNTLHNVGTIQSGSGQRLGQTLTGFDTPSLIGLWNTAPYLHNGAAATLNSVLQNTTHVGSLNGTQINQLVAYLRQIDDIESGVAANNTPRFVRLVAESEVNGNPWAAIAELNVLDASGSAINRAGWSVTVDSQHTGYEGSKAIDGNNATIWHTQYSPTSPAYPHELVINLGGPYHVRGFKYLPRQDMTNGRVANYKFYLSSDGFNWGSAVAQGTFPNNTTEQTVTLSTSSYRYVRLVAESEVNGNAWSSIAELEVLNAGGTPITRTGWVATVDSQHTGYEGSKAIDGNTATMWHTQYSPTSPAYPHEIVVDLGTSQVLGGFSYLPRQDGNPNGRIAAYKFYVSQNGVTWGVPVAQGTFPNNQTKQTITFPLGLRPLPEGQQIYLPLVIK